MDFFPENDFRHPGTMWLERNWSERGEYNNVWVTANAEGLVAIGELEVVLNELSEMEMSLDDVVFAFVSWDIHQ